MRRILIVLGLICLFGVSAIHAHEPTEGREGRAEVRFLEGMIDHHQMALDMATDCLAKAGAEVKSICEAVIGAQTPEIEQMQAWLLEWYNIEYSPMPMQAMEMDSMHMNMDGMPATDPAMMMGMFAGFNRLEGTEYDVAWLESMIDHHDDALHMSNRLLGRLGDKGHDELKALAQNIITSQSTEIAQMEALIVTLSQ